MAKAVRVNRRYQDFPARGYSRAASNMLINTGFSPVVTGSTVAAVSMAFFTMSQ